MAPGKAKDKWSNPAREKRSGGKEARRIARREQEAEDWAQARLKGLSCDLMPTNKSGWDYLTIHHPKLVHAEKDRKQNKAQQTYTAAIVDVPEASKSKEAIPNTDVAADSRLTATSTPLKLEDDGKQHSNDLEQEKKDFTIPQTPVVYLNGSHDLDHKDSDKQGAISRKLDINLSEALPTTTSTASLRSSYAAALTSKVQPIKDLRVAVPRLAINQKVDTRLRLVQNLTSISTNVLANKLSNVSGNSSTTSLHKNVLAQGTSAASSKRENWKVPATAGDRCVSQGLLNQQDIEKRSSSALFEANPGIQPHKETGYLPYHELEVSRTAGIESVVQDLQKPSGSPQKSLLRGIPARILSEAVYRRGIAVETIDHKSIFEQQNSNTAPRVILPPAEGDLRTVSRILHTPSINMNHLPCSPRTQALRATAPTFVPHTPTTQSGGRMSQMYSRPPMIASPSRNTSGLRLHNGSSQPAAAFAGNNGRRIISPASLPGVSFRPHNQFDEVPRSSASTECQCDVGFTAHYRSISTKPPPPINVQSDTTNAEYLSGPNDGNVHTARAVFALEVARRTTGLSADELMSFLAIRVPSIDPMLDFPRIMKAVYSKQEPSQQCNLFRYFAPVPQRPHNPDCPYANDRNGATKKSAHNAKSDENSANEEKRKSQYGAGQPFTWQAEDFQGFRVIPEELKLAEEDYDLLALAKVARISLRRPGSEGYSREQHELTPAGRGNSNEEHFQTKDTFNEQFTNMFEPYNNPTSPQCENTVRPNESAVPGQETMDTHTNTNQKTPRNYKELAAMSDVDTIASENGEHADDEFFVGRPVKNKKREQIGRDNLNTAVVSNPSTPLPPFNTYAQTPATSYSDTIHQHQPYQMSAIHQGQYPQYPGPHNSTYFSQMQSPPHHTNAWTQQQSFAFQHQLPMDPHWQWQWQHAGTHPNNNHHHQHAPLYLMNGTGGGNTWQGYPQDFWMVLQQHGEHGRANPEHYGHGGP